MNTDKFTGILAIFIAGTLLGGAAGCKSDADFRKERLDKTITDFPKAQKTVAAPGKILSLEDCINAVLNEGNVKLQSASLEKQAFESMRLAEGLGILLPRAELSGRITGSHSNSGKFNTASSSSGFTGRLEHELSYTLLDACVAAFQTSQAHDRYLLRKMRSERMKQNIVLEVSKLYFRIAALQKNIEKIRFFRGKLEEYRILAAKNFRLEMIDQAQTTYSSELEAALRNYEAEYESAKSRMQALMGLYPNGDIEVDTRILENLPSLPGTVEEREELALMQRPELFIGDIRSHIHKSDCWKTFFKLFSALRLYSGAQLSTHSGSWENVAWTACNLLKTPELLLQLKEGRTQEELEKLQTSLQALAVMAQVRMAEAACISNGRISNSALEEYKFLARKAPAVKKGEKSSADILTDKNIFDLQAKLSLVYENVEKARKEAEKIKEDPQASRAKKKAADAKWQSALQANAAKINALKKALQVALERETLRILAAIGEIRKDLSAAQLQSSYRTCFNAMGFSDFRPDSVKSAIDKLKMAKNGSAKDALNVASRKYNEILAKRNKSGKNRQLFQKGAGAYVNKEYIRSAEFLKRAAERGNVEALFGLGKLYWNGQGVPRDYTMAIRCYEKAAEKGKVEAMLIAGWLYYRGYKSENGIILEKDLEKARKYYMMAADRNEERAFYNLGMIHFEMKDYKQALDFFKFAGRGGDTTSMVWAGTLYRNGLPEKNLEKAIQWYEMAAKNGDLNAMNCLYMIYKGAFDGEKENMEKAREWQEKYKSALEKK